MLMLMVVVGLVLTCIFVKECEEGVSCVSKFFCTCFLETYPPIKFGTKKEIYEAFQASYRNERNHCSGRQDSK